ncbi:MAG: transketolase [Planctomycetes bacterium]|nr:transketolase [Planctomycetota bacterium]
MGAELGEAAQISEADRYRSGLEYPNPLAGNPGALSCASTVKQSDGSDLEVADPTVTRLCVALMNMHAVIGGAACHWGGPSAYAEIMSSAHALVFAKDNWYQHTNFVNDAGHAENGVYALKANYGFAGLSFDDLRGFRSVESKLTGHGESHLFADGVMVSNGPLGSGLPVAQGLAMADRLANNDRLSVCVISDGAMMEGEAREAVAAIPGLAAAGKVNPFVMIVSDNNTKLSGRIDEQSYSMQPSFDALVAQGWDVRKVEAGHDLQTVFTAIEKSFAEAPQQANKPIALWVKTIKGKGVKATEESSSGGHGYPLKKPSEVRAFCEEIAAGSELPEFVTTWIADLEKIGADAEAAAANKPASSSSVKKEKIQAGFSRAMISSAEAGLPVVSISADLQGSTGVAAFQSSFPQLSFDVGIAESNMVSAASGFSKQGYIPVVDTFAQFGVTKGLLPLCMASLSQAGVIAVFSHIGFQDAADGASHQGLMYLAMTGAVPHLKTYCPASSEEAEWAMNDAIQYFAVCRKAGTAPDSILFFCGRENFPSTLLTAGQSYEWGKALCVADTTAGKDKSVVISANASMVAYALEAVAALEEAGIGAKLLNNATANKPDVAAHQEALAACGGRLITVEDHQAIGGAGECLVSALKQAGSEFTLRLLGVNEAFGQSAYMAQELYDIHNIGPDAMIAAAKGICA